MVFTLGGMAGSDVVLAWLDDSGPVIKDMHLLSQAPSGVLEADRQGIWDADFGMAVSMVLA